MARKVWPMSKGGQEEPEPPPLLLTALQIWHDGDSLRQWPSFPPPPQDACATSRCSFEHSSGLLGAPVDGVAGLGTVEEWPMEGTARRRSKSPSDHFTSLSFPVLVIIWIHSLCTNHGMQDHSWWQYTFPHPRTQRKICKAAKNSRVCICLFPIYLNARRMHRCASWLNRMAGKRQHLQGITASSMTLIRDYNPSVFCSYDQTVTFLFQWGSWEEFIE